ncbi:MAG: hypothetical protein M0Q93_00390 [Terrimicrobiaceae bacterium]|nr:hypothetical protein [Terrimicrobiaceae bacterium]
MKKLSDSFRKEGFDHKVLKREGDVVLIRKTKEAGGHYDGYEVAIVQSHQGYRFGNETFPPAEFMPRNEDWGWKGFSFTDLERAEIKFAKLVKAANSPKKIQLKKL